MFIDIEFTIYELFMVFIIIEMPFYFKIIGIVLFKCTFAENLSILRTK